MIISAPRILLVLSLSLLLISIVFLCVGLNGDKWMFAAEDNYFGLYKSCTPNFMKCTKRENIMEFKDETSIIHVSIKDRDLDTVMVLLIVAILFAFFATISSFTMCCLKGKTSWQCLAAFTGTLASFGGLLGVAALGYFENIASDLSDSYDHKWSSILTWVGVLILIIAAVLAFIMICVKSKPDLSNQGHMVYTHNITNYPSKEYHTSSKPTHVTRDNRGFDADGSSKRSDRIDSREISHSRQHESKDYWMDSAENEYQHSRKSNQNNRESKNHSRDSRAYQQDTGRRDGNQQREYHANRDYERSSRNYPSRNTQDRSQDYSDYRHDTQPYEIRSSHRTRHPSYDNEGYEMR